MYVCNLYHCYRCFSNLLIVSDAVVCLLWMFSLAGMLLMGFALRNIPCIKDVCINVAEDIDQVWSSALRWVYFVYFAPKSCCMNSDIK